MSADPSHVLRITRRFDASPERVFDAAALRERPVPAGSRRRES